MKYLFLVSTILILISCGQANKFSKQKFTNLKKVRHVDGPVFKDEIDDDRDNDILYECPNENYPAQNDNSISGADVSLAEAGFSEDSLENYSEIEEAEFPPSVTNISEDEYPDNYKRDTKMENKLFGWMCFFFCFFLLPYLNWPAIIFANKLKQRIEATDELHLSKKDKRRLKIIKCFKIIIFCVYPFFLLLAVVGIIAYFDV